MKKTIVLGACIFLLGSCSNVEEQKDTATENQQTAAHAESHHNETDDAIELNNGEKWMVNEEMKPFVLKGNELVNTYVRENKTDFKTLAEQLKDQNNQLIQSCTMTGKSHDELHKWLHPHIELVENLAQATALNKANEIVKQLQHSYQVYGNYFQ